MIDKLIGIMKSIDRNIADMDVRRELPDGLYDVIFHSIVADNCLDCVEMEVGWGCKKLSLSTNGSIDVAICTRAGCPRMYKENDGL